MERLTLTQVARLIKSEWVLLLLGIISLSIFALAIFSFTKVKPQETPQGIVWQKNIVAGKSTTEDIKATLGTPTKTQEEQGGISYFYATSNQYRLNEIEFRENTVSIIKEQVIGNEKGVLNNYLQKYDQPETKLFGQHGTFAPGHFWGQKGLLVFAGSNDGTIVEIWYFTPITIANFLKNNPSLTQEEPKRF